MNSSEIKKLVRRYRTEFGIRQATAEALEDAFRKQGFTIIEYEPSLQDLDVRTVVQNLGLEDMVKRTNGFLFVDKRYRLIFLHEGLSGKEKKLILAHEEGHYYCRHITQNNVIGRSVTEEYEANEFAHFLLQEDICTKAVRIAQKHKKQLLIGCAVVIAFIMIAVFSKGYHDRQIYEGEFYVTMHGEKYHREGCVTIQGHETRRLTKEDAENGAYEPCGVCRPDKD